MSDVHENEDQENEDLQVRLYMKSRRFREAVKHVYAEQMKKMKRKKAPKVKESSYALRAAKYLVYEGVPLALTTAAFAKMNINTTRRYHLQNDVRMADILLHSFNQARAYRHGGAVGLAHATVAGTVHIGTQVAYNRARAGVNRFAHTHLRHHVENIVNHGANLSDLARARYRNWRQPRAHARPFYPGRQPFQGQGVRLGDMVTGDTAPIPIGKPYEVPPPTGDDLSRATAPDPLRGLVPDSVQPTFDAVTTEALEGKIPDAMYGAKEYGVNWAGGDPSSVGSISDLPPVSTQQPPSIGPQLPEDYQYVKEGFDRLDRIHAADEVKQAKPLSSGPHHMDPADQIAGRTFSQKMLDSMRARGGRIAQFGSFIEQHGTKIATGVQVAGAAASAAAIAYGGVQLHKMHKYRNELRSIADEHKDDAQIQEFFRINDEAVKRHDAYFGVNTAIGTLGITSGLASAGIASGAVAGTIGAEGALTTAGVLAGPVGWAVLGLTAVAGLFSWIYESAKKKQAYREYLTKLYGSADSPSLDYYLEHKDPDLLEQVNSIKNYETKDDATDEFKTYVESVKGKIKAVESDIDIKEGVDDPRRQKLYSILHDTVPAVELDKTSDFISRQRMQDIQLGDQVKEWSTDDIIDHAKRQYQSDMYRYQHRDHYIPDTVNMTETDYYDQQDEMNNTETIQKGYGRVQERG